MKSNLPKIIWIVGIFLALVTAVAAAQPALDETLPAITSNLKAETAYLVAAPIVQPKGTAGSEWYIIQLQDEPLATYGGGIAEFEATNPTALGKTKLDANTEASRRYLAYIEAQQAAFVLAVEQNLGRSVPVAHQYQYAFNGVALEMTPQEAAVVATLPNVRRLHRNFYRQLLTDYGPQWIGADAIWDGSAAAVESQGEGIVIGVIDSGINADHPSFADPGPVDNYDHENPLGTGHYAGWCDPDHPQHVAMCNDKLIGVYSFATSGNDPEDDDGHGSHTASTAAGNVVDATMDISATIDVLPGLPVTTTNAFVYEASISGVAPHANIIAYDACGPQGCPLIDLVAAIDQSVADAVDVINYSIGGGSSNPWVDPDALAFLGAFEAGIIPVTSAGNEGPDPQTLSSPADAPWLLTAGASTHNRDFANTLANMSGGDIMPPDAIVGAGMSETYGPAPVVYAGDYGNGQCVIPFAPGTFDGEIVVCDRGLIARVEKGVNVLAGGAGGYVLANASDGQTLNSDAHALPAIHIGFEDGEALKTWLASGSGHMATIAGSSIDVDDANGDVMAGFSSRGPNPAVLDLIKPDVTAPGKNILAAYKSGLTNDTVEYVDEFNVISGTSMASPHVAGAAVLLRAIHPNWTAAQIRSALMTTAVTTTRKEDGTTPADPFDEGSGRVQVDLAAQAGFVLDETAAAYMAADPDVGGDPVALNIASLGNSRCPGICRWTRTLSSTVGADVTWNASVAATPGLSLTVEPATFTLGAYATQILTITADVSAASDNQWIFGQAAFTTTAGIPDAHFPVAVVPVPTLLPDQVEIHTRRDAGSQPIEGLQAKESSALTITPHGLVKPTLTTKILSQDITNNSPYDNLNNGVFYVLVEVPAGARRLVAEIVASQSPDVDLFWGMDSNGNGMPEKGEQLDAATTSSYSEYLNANYPAAGTYWVLAQNWRASADGALDEITLATAVVDGSDNGHLSATGPGSVPSGTPFGIRLFWDDSRMRAGDYRYGALSLRADGNPDDIGLLPINIRRREDDVVKKASVPIVPPGKTLTYMIRVQPNLLPEAITYALTDTIPAGLTYVAGSAAATAGSVEVVENQLTWTGTLQPPGNIYYLSTNRQDPGCRTPLGGYWDLEATHGLKTLPNLFGDEIIFHFEEVPEFYGRTGGVLKYTADGYATMGEAVAATNQQLPDPTPPNELIAIWWRDMRIIYNQSANRGVTVASNSLLRIVEFDDIEDAADPDQRLDMEIITLLEPADDLAEIMLAYDNVNLTSNTGTIGVENAGGMQALQLAYNDLMPTDGLVVCFDWAPVSTDPVVITYQVVVGEVAFGSSITNVVVHRTDNPGNREASADAAVSIGYPLYLPIISS